MPFQWPNGSPEFDDLFTAALENLLGPRRAPAVPLDDRHRDIARSIQAMYEEAFFHILALLHRQTGATALALAGGCAANSVANGKVRRVTPFQNVYVQAAAGDAGGAIGAAFAVWQKLGGGRDFVMDHAFWAPIFPLMRSHNCWKRAGATLPRAVAALSWWQTKPGFAGKPPGRAGGKVVGWFQGRMEWGPRALGNRSIVCDPRRADMKAILNAKIKRRKSFRPLRLPCSTMQSRIGSKRTMLFLS